MRKQTNAKGEEVEPIQSFEISPETLTFTQGEGTRNTKIKQYLCVRPMMPKSGLYQAILHENISQDRHLERLLDGLNSRQMKTANSMDLTQRTFLARQEKKQKKWKREDEVRLYGMNFPSIAARTPTERPQSMQAVYRMPEYSARPKPEVDEKLKSSLPEMPYTLRREQTEIVLHRDRTFITRLPGVREVNPKGLERHNTYCGLSFLKTGTPSQDTRFKRLEFQLEPAELGDVDQYPIENLTSKSRLSKYSQSTSNESEEKDKVSSAIPNKPKQEKWIITRADTDLTSTGIKSEIETNGERTGNGRNKKRMKKSDAILESFKTKDVKKLAKTLAKKDKKPEIEVVQKSSVFVPGVNVFYSKNKE